MNEDNMPGDHVEANQWQAMLRDWRLLLIWEIVAGLVLNATYKDAAAITMEVPR